MIFNRFLPAMLTIALTGLPALTRADVYSETKEFDEDFAGGRTFHVETLSGSIKLTGVEGSRVRVKAVKNARGGEKEAKKALEELTVEMNRNGDRLDVVARFPGEDGFFSRIFENIDNDQDTWVDFDISLPAGLYITVDATSAGVDVDNIAGDISLDVTSGAVAGDLLGGDVSVDGTSGTVELKRVGGNVTVDNTSGEIDVEACGGDVEIDNTSGNVLLREIEGNVDVDGTSSDVTGETIKGYVTLDLISGDVRLKGMEEGLSLDIISGDTEASFDEGPGRKSELSSISGDIRLRIPAETDLDLNLESVSGELRTEIEGLKIIEISNSSMRAVTGEGKVELSIDTVSGDVEITGEIK